MTPAREATIRLAELLRHEQHALADFLVALSVFDRERRWVDLGDRSLFPFLTRELGLSKGAAYYRMTAAGLVQEHPEVLAALRDGNLCLTSIAELSKVLTAENRAEVLPRFFHLSKREAKEVTAEPRPAPAPPLRTVVTATSTSTSAVPSCAPTSMPQPIVVAVDSAPFFSQRATAPFHDGYGSPGQPRACQLAGPRCGVREPRAGLRAR